MKPAVFQILSLLIMTLFMSCSSTYNLMIETQQPAKITFPVKNPYIVVINNAAPQPIDVGFIHHQKVLKEVISDKPVNINPPNSKETSRITVDTVYTDLVLSPKFTDTLLLAAVQTFSKKLKPDDHYFYDVALYDTPLKTNNEWLNIQSIPADTITNICNEIDADIVISIDRIIFLLGQTLTSSADNELVANQIVKTQLSCSAYLKGKSKSLTSFTVNDTILEELYFFRFDSLTIFRSAPESTLYLAAQLIAEKAAETFIPTWQKTERLIYTGQNSRMQEALAFAKKNEWENAQNTWKQLYDLENNSKNKAELANNIAISYEMQDQFDVAQEWLNEGIQILQVQKSSKVQKTLDQLTAYKGILEKRMQEDVLLDQQLQ